MNRQLPPAGRPGLRFTRINPWLLASAALIVNFVAPSASVGQFHSNPTTRPAAPSSASYPIPPSLVGADLSNQTMADVDRKSVGCIQCHQGSIDPHAKATVRLG